MMGVFWLLIILLCCTSPNRCDVLSPEQPWDIHCRTAEKTNSLYVPCPKIKPENLIMDNTTDITITLYRNRIEIYKICTEPSKKNQTIKQHGVTPQKEHGKFTGFIIKLEGNIEQAVYTCKVEKSYPPPFVTSEGKSVVVLEEGQGCANKTGTCKKDDSEPRTPQRPIWIWILVVALLCTYSLAVTIAALVIWHKMQDADSQNDYINTKPKAPPNRRKKRGIQHPIPKHF
ncbi:PREDICTED: T-cell-specific surface glycoprotein CD28-like [Cyprinodon variegatus]|uniref:T-cell-specific surface glycoprotein CD28-like n=1 Tax=Cyprinodon variegatus TaxID=28743 RepID=A0A3Q2D252_CYPVA|nr:PREDICTED: T-cell-specific surface glycoprotein CD28-like [Cyprinodon variegatus]